MATLTSCPGVSFPKVGNYECVSYQTLTILYISFLFRLSMADLSTARKGEITIDKNVSYKLVVVEVCNY